MFPGGLDIKQIKPHIDEKYHLLIDSLYEKYNNFSYGNTRIVFYTGHGYVVKVPHNLKGEKDNIKESNIYLLYRRCFAKCRLFIRQNIPILIMEQVITNHKLATPDWARELGSCALGIDRKGQLVVFDYGNIND